MNQDCQDYMDASLPVVTLVRGKEDWQGLYINDDLITEGHNVYTFEALMHVSSLGRFSLYAYTISDSADKWLNEYGSLPDSLEQLNKL